MTPRRLLFLSAAFALATAGRADESAKDVAPRATKVVAPVHPPELYGQKIGGEAEIECLVTEAGQVMEARMKSATRPEFGEAALVAVRQWEFQPGERDGKPVAMRVGIPFNFPTPFDHPLETLLKRKIFVELDEPAVSAEKLGTWPMPKKLLEPAYPPELAGSGKRGKAVVSVIINQQGQVVNPVLVKSTFPEFELSALVAAARLEFPPQLGPDKKPVNVAMDVQFDFRDEGRRPKKKPDEPAEPAKKKE